MCALILSVSTHNAMNGHWISVQIDFVVGNLPESTGIERKEGVSLIWARAQSESGPTVSRLMLNSSNKVCHATTGLTQLK